MLKGSANNCSLQPAHMVYPGGPQLIRTAQCMCETRVLPQDCGSCINYTCEICQARVDMPRIFMNFWYKITPRVFISTIYLFIRKHFRRICVILKLQKIEDIIYHCAVQVVKLDAKIFLPFCDFYSCTFITV